MMHEYSSRRGQEMLLVLYALSDLGGIRTRQEVVDHISYARWYELVQEDFVPTRTSREARYRIDLAWARKDCVLQDYINNFETNAWELNRKGRDFIEKRFEGFRTGRLKLSRCEFFTIGFKRIAVPSYQVTKEDRKRVSPSELLEGLEKLFDHEKE